MTKTLAILVSSDRHLAHVIQLTRAACAKGKQVQLFLTGKGVRLTTLPQFAELAARACVAVCDVSFRASGLEKEKVRAPGVKFTNQAANARILLQADRYLVL